MNIKQREYTIFLSYHNLYRNKANKLQPIPQKIVPLPRKKRKGRLREKRIRFIYDKRNIITNLTFLEYNCECQKASTRIAATLY